MATLEVHDGEGRVQYIEIARDHPVLFGTSPTCDVQLEGSGIRPVHGRIRWKATNYRLEASPDAEFVLVNGHKMTTSSLQQGDEIVVGGCRIYLIRVDDDLGKASQSRSLPDNDRTRVLAPSDPRAPDARKRKGRARKGGSEQDEPLMIEKDDWLAALRPERRAREASDAPAAPLPRGRNRGAAEREVVLEPPPKAKPIWAGWAARLQAAGNRVAPGREKIATSPVVIGLVASIAILVGMGFWLRSIIASTVASRTFNRGVQAFDDGDYRTAMRDLDVFVTTNPADSRTGKARVLRSFANVRQYISPDGATWSSALEAADEMVDQVGELGEFRDERVDLAELVIKIGEGLADRARQAADPKALAQAETAVSLHARIAGEPALAFLNKSRLPSKLAEARAAVRKAEIRTRYLAAMDQALKEGSSSRVYDARDALVAEYTDISQDRELIKRMTDANELVRRAVTIDSARKPAEHTARPDPLGPPLSVVLRSQQQAPAASITSESIIFALADGAAYGLDATTGAPLWHVPVGLASPFVPQPIPGDGTVVAFDARHNDLDRFDAKTGALKWRLALGEPVVDPPLVVGNQLAQVLPSGKLLLIGLESGELETTVNLGRPLARSPVNDESGQHLYILGRQDCVFIVARDPFACVAVVYLGHPDGSIACAPARLGRFLIAAENDSLSNSRLNILLLDEEGAKARPVQTVAVAGWTWQTPASAGPVVWGIGDKGGYEAFSVGDDTGKTPFRSIARLTADATSSGPAYSLVRSDREIWVASGHSGRFELDAERGAIEPKNPIAQPGPALAPIQLAGQRLVMTFQDRETGGTALWGLNPETGATAWKTIIGAPWTAVPVRSAGADQLSLLTRDGREITVSQEQISQGGFLVESMPRPGEFALPAGLRLQFESGGKAFSALVPAHRSNLLWTQDPAKPGSWLKTGLPAEIAADPLPLGGAVFIPGKDARAYLVDPVTALSRAEPFVPKFDRDRQGSWLSPVLIDSENVALADSMGRIHRVALKTSPAPRLVGEAQATLPRRIIAGPVSTGAAVVIVTDDQLVRALAARDLSPVGSWELAAPLAGKPVGHAGGCLVMDRSGGVMALGADGKRVWSVNLGAEVVGATLIDDQSVWLVTQDGTLHVRDRKDGAERDRLSLGILPSEGLLRSGARVLVASGGGTIRAITAELGGTAR